MVTSTTERPWSTAGLTKDRPVEYCGTASKNSAWFGRIRLLIDRGQIVVVETELQSLYVPLQKFLMQGFIASNFPLFSPLHKS